MWRSVASDATLSGHCRNSGHGCHLVDGLDVPCLAKAVGLPEKRSLVTLLVVGFSGFPGRSW
jgi:hypothetical protein